MSCYNHNSNPMPGDLATVHVHLSQNLPSWQASCQRWRRGAPATGSAPAAATATPSRPSRSAHSTAHDAGRWLPPRPAEIMMAMRHLITSQQGGGAWRCSNTAMLSCHVAQLPGRKATLQKVCMFSPQMRSTATRAPTLACDAVFSSAPQRSRICSSETISARLKKHNGTI